MKTLQDLMRACVNRFSMVTCLSKATMDQSIDEARTLEYTKRNICEAIARATANKGDWNMDTDAETFITSVRVQVFVFSESELRKMIGQAYELGMKRAEEATTSASTSA